MATHAASQRKPAPVSPALSLDEELWFGTSDSEAAEEAAASSMAATAGKIVGAKHFPESARKLAELARSESTPVPEFVRVLEHDPALSAQLLRMVNSSGFALRQRCTSVRHAVTIVGTKNLHQLATTAAVLDLFDSETTYAVEILRHSAAMGACCRYLGAHLGLPTEALFTIGALHDIGKLMLLDGLGERYDALIDRAGQGPDALHLIERAELGFDHGVLAAHVLKAWDIPDPIPKIVAWHHEPGRAYASSAAHASLVQTVRFADALVHAIGQGATRQDVSRLARHEAASYLEISEAQLDALWDDLVRLHAQALEKTEDGAANASEAGSMTRLASRPPSSGPALPKHFPCVECGSSSFGSTCPACNGDLCPVHPPTLAGWCSLCARDYDALANASGFLGSAYTEVWVALALLVALGTAAWSAVTGDGLLGGLGAGVVFALVASLAFAVLRRSYLRTRFLRNRPDRSHRAG